MKLNILFPILCAGAVAGFFGASQFWPTPTRAERIATLFTQICLPNHYGRQLSDPEKYNLFEVVNFVGTTVWIDPLSASILTVDPSHCTIESHAPNALSAAEANALLILIEDIVATEFPDLPYDPKSKMGSISKAWITGPVASPQRWGVYLFAYPEWGDAAGSRLSINTPEFDA